MKIHFVTYSDKKYRSQQEKLNERAINFFNLNSYTQEWLISTDFYSKFKHILDLPRGGGYWLWKPMIILDVLNKIEYGDVLFYRDCGDSFKDGITEFLSDYFGNSNVDSLLTYGGENKQKWYTKRDAFSLMDCDEEKYYEHIQLEAGMICLRKTENNVNIVKLWLDYCTNPNIITDIENITGPNFDDFIDHRHDQSVLTNLAIKFNLNINNLLRQYVTCNVN